MTDELLDRPMPQFIEAERAVLGSVLIHNAALWRVLPLINASDFFRDTHRTIFAAMRAIADSGAEVDLLSLKDELARRNELGSVGGAAYIASLTDGIPDVANVERYARMVAQKAKLRRLIAVGNSIMTRALEAEDEPETIAADALAALTATATNQQAQGRRVAEVVDEAFAEAEKRFDANESVAYRTGFTEIDGYQAICPTLIIIGAPSGHGKTAYAINLAEGLAENGRTSLFCSLESTERQIAWRYVSAESGVPHHRVRDWRRLDESDFPKIAQAQAKSRRLPIYLTRRIRDVEAMYAECRRLQTVGGLHALIVDYVQLVRLSQGPRDREERIAMISQRLLEIALDLEIAVIATSQLNKEWQERHDGMLYPTDLKYAAAIGESARVVLMFQRPHVRDPLERPCLVRFQVAKNNEERTGSFEAHFDERIQKFADGDCERNRCRRLAAEQSTFQEAYR